MRCIGQRREGPRVNVRQFDTFRQISTLLRFGLANTNIIFLHQALDVDGVRKRDWIDGRRDIAESVEWDEDRLLSFGVKRGFGVGSAGGGGAFVVG